MKKTKIIGLFAVLFICINLLSVHSIGLPGPVRVDPIRIGDNIPLAPDHGQADPIGIGDNPPIVRQGIIGRIIVFVAGAAEGIGEGIGAAWEQIQELFLSSISSDEIGFLDGTAKKSSTIYIAKNSQNSPDILLATKENIRIYGEDANLIARYKNIDNENLCQLLMEDTQKNDYNANCAYDPDKKEYTLWVSLKDIDDVNEKRFWNSLTSTNRLR